MKVSEGFQVADSRNLPSVDYLMLMEYMHENDCYNVAETRSAKALLASREAYVDTAVGYVEVKREGNLCTVKCRVTPEHKVKAKLYVVSATIDETAEKIIKVECNDCAASLGRCKHAICFAIWLIKRSDEPSVTSTVCYWAKPKLAAAAADKQYILAKNLGKKKKHLPEDENMDVTLSMFTEECIQHNVSEGMILRYCQEQQPNLNDVSIFNLMLQFIQEVQNDHSYGSFKSWSHAFLTENMIEMIKNQTKDQANSKLWHAMRQGRVTGSRIHEAVHCKTDNGALVQSIMGGYKVPETIAIKRGKLLEKKVLKELENEFGTNIETIGLILISPIIGVSPDGVCNDFVIEIKCPMSEKTMSNYVKDNQLQEKFKAQIMLQMYGAKKRKGLFCVADPNFEQSKIIYKHWVYYDEQYVKDLLNAAEHFWQKYIFVKILESVK